MNAGQAKTMYTQCILIKYNTFYIYTMFNEYFLVPSADKALS